MGLKERHRLVFSTFLDRDPQMRRTIKLSFPFAPSLSVSLFLHPIPGSNSREKKRPEKNLTVSERKKEKRTER